MHEPEASGYYEWKSFSKSRVHVVAGEHGLVGVIGRFDHGASHSVEGAHVANLLVYRAIDRSRELSEVFSLVPKGVRNKRARRHFLELAFGQLVLSVDGLVFSGVSISRFEKEFKPRSLFGSLPEVLHEAMAHFVRDDTLEVFVSLRHSVGNVVGVLEDD